MKTVYYTFHTREAAAGAARASGGEDRLVRFLPAPLPRRPVRRRDNIIDLSDYLAAAGPDSLAEAVSPPPAPAPRARTDHGRDRLACMEWLACAAMICLAVAACAALLL